MLERQVQRQGFLVSALVHLVVLMVLIARPAPDRTGFSDASPSARTQGPRVFLPPPEELRRLAPQPRTPIPQPTPPPAAAGKDRDQRGSALDGA